MKENYSFSKLSSFNGCKYGYLLNYIKCCEACSSFNREEQCCEHALADFDPLSSPIERTHCPFFTKYVNEENAFSQYGTMVHGILEEYERGDLAEWELVDSFKERFEKEITKDFPWNAYVDLKESYFNDGVRFFENFDGFKNMKIIDAEHEFTDDFDDFRINGFIDLSLEEKNNGEITG